MSFTTKPNNLERRLTNLVETSKFISLSCLLWRLSVPFFSTNGKHKACSFAWEVELSFNFVVKLKQRCGSYPFWRIFLCPLTHSHINVLWASIRGECIANFIRFQSRIRSLYNLWAECGLPVWQFAIIRIAIWLVQHHS